VGDASGPGAACVCPSALFTVVCCEQDVIINAAIKMEINVREFIFHLFFIEKPNEWVIIFIQLNGMRNIGDVYGQIRR
jgi:hypothetical protein